MLPSPDCGRSLFLSILWPALRGPKSKLGKQTELAVTNNYVPYVVNIDVFVYIFYFKTLAAMAP